jgi:hypothetical protein
MGNFPLILFVMRVLWSWFTFGQDWTRGVEGWVLHFGAHTSIYQWRITFLFFELLSFSSALATKFFVPELIKIRVRSQSQPSVQQPLQQWRQSTHSKFHWRHLFKVISRYHLSNHTSAYLVPFRSSPVQKHYCSHSYKRFPMA